MNVKVKGADAAMTQSNSRNLTKHNLESKSERQLLPRSSRSIVEPQISAYQGIYFNNLDPTWRKQRKYLDKFQARMRIIINDEDV